VVPDDRSVTVLTRRASVLVLAAGLGPLAGCLATHSGAPVHGTQPAILGQHPVPGINAPLPDHWRRVFIGQLPHPRMMGYVRSARTEASDGPGVVVHWVYDIDMKLVGVVGENGHTTRFDRFGKAHSLGDLPMDQDKIDQRHAILAIYDFDEPEK